jgi:hypothetical protein
MGATYDIIWSILVYYITLETFVQQFFLYINYMEIFKKATIALFLFELAIISTIKCYVQK